MFGKRAHHHARRILGHAKTAFDHFGRGFGTAAKVYHAVAPHLLPLAEEHLGREQAHSIHNTISSGITHYNRAKDRGLGIGGAVGKIAHAINRP